MFYKTYTYINKLFQLSFLNKEYEDKFQQRYLKDNLFQNFLSVKIVLIVYLIYYVVAYYVTPTDFLNNVLYILYVPIIVAIIFLRTTDKNHIEKNHTLKLFIFMLAIGYPPLMNLALTTINHQIYLINFMLVIFSVYIISGSPFVVSFLSVSLLFSILLLMTPFLDIETSTYFYLLFVMTTTFVVSMIGGYLIENNHRKNYLAIFKQEELNRKLIKEQAKSIQQEKLLQEQTRLAQMGEMISMIAHQWRQPLGAIGNSSIAIQLKYKSQKYNTQTKEEFMYKKLHNIDEYVKVLSHTIDDFRSFFQPNKDKELTPITVPIQKALNIVSSSISYHNISVITNFNNNDEVLVYQNEIMQVILNLLKNAEDNFIEKDIKNASITISTKKIEGYYRIKIEDNGGGIPIEILPNIFDPYFSTKEKRNGTGLGLYMSKIIIEEHNQGRLTVHNCNSGVCFEIIL